MNTDNQQVRDISWLAGLMDGEGCITLQSRILRKRNPICENKKKAIDYIPDIIIINSNWNIIENADRILKELNIGHYIYSIKGYESRPDRKPSSMCKPKWGIRIAGLFRCKSFLVEVSPYLIGKKREAEVLHAYICSRLSHPNKNYRYTDDEIKAHEILHMLKEMSNPNDYTLNIFIDKMKI